MKTWIIDIDNQLRAIFNVGGVYIYLALFWQIYVTCILLSYINVEDDNYNTSLIRLQAQGYIYGVMAQNAKILQRLYHFISL
jgi:hypothetical protein